MQQTHLEASPAIGGAVTSQDGTIINYLTVGQGPSLILIPGALSVASDYADFASALGQAFTVHTIERRGRGRSGPQGDRYCIDRECEDVAALQAETGSRYLVGHSYGGLIALEAARNSKLVHKIAVYEPGVSVDGLISMDWAAGYQRNLADNRVLDAFVDFNLAVGPDRIKRTPRLVMKIGILLALPKEKRKTMLRLLPENLLEHREVARLDNSYENYREVTAPTLLMRGGKSDLGWVGPAMERLSEVLPVAELRTFPKLDHFGPEHAGRHEVARAVEAHLLA
jgi:pimeloyl-ACP methyl ester carboxylesterase